MRGNILKVFAFKQIFPPLQASSSSPILRIRIWSIRITLRGALKLSYHRSNVLQYSSSMEFRALEFRSCGVLLFSQTPCSRLDFTSFLA